MQEKNLQKLLEKQQKTLRNADNFLRQISLNRYMLDNLVDLDFSDGTDFIYYLIDDDFYIGYNFLSPLTHNENLGEFLPIMEKIQLEYNKADMNWIEFLLFLNKTKTASFLSEYIPSTIHENVTFSELLNGYVVSRCDIDLGDSPPLILIFIATKAIIAKHFLKENIVRLEQGNTDITDITPFL